jgi:hypothetical protein
VSDARASFSHRCPYIITDCLAFVNPFFEKNFKKFPTKNDRRRCIAVFCLKSSFEGKNAGKRKRTIKKHLKSL